jgi:phage shock protein PspC (stress-responsive transcriptional regulator)
MVRLLFVLAALIGGHGLLAYLIIALVVPIEPEAEPFAS